MCTDLEIDVGVYILGSKWHYSDKWPDNISFIWMEEIIAKGQKGFSIIRIKYQGVVTCPKKTLQIIFLCPK